MKSLIKLVLTSFICLFTLHAFSFPPVVIGSGVSIPVLNSGNVGSLFSISSSTITQSVTIVGDLEINGLTGLAFSGSTVAGGDKINFVDSKLTFRNCIWHDMGTIALDDSFLTFTGTTIEDCNEVDLTSNSRIDAYGSTIFSDFVYNIFVQDNSVFNGYDCTFDNAPVVAIGKITVILQECILLNNFPAGVSLLGGGYYYGSNNIFHDNEDGVFASTAQEDFTHMEERGSQFYDNNSNAFALQSVSEVYIVGNDINTEGQTSGLAIKIREGNGVTVVEDNSISGSVEVRYGLAISYRKNATVENNTITGIGHIPPITESAAISLSYIDNLLVEGNEVYDNTDAFGIMIMGCPGAQVMSNTVSGHIRNIDLSESTGGLLESNICSHATESSIYVTNSQALTLCSNSCYYDEDGITLSSTEMMLEMNDNSMSHCGRGLVYKQDVLANPQENKGNYFLLNTLGAEYEDQSNEFVISASKYIVRDLSTEFPSHEPEAWFENTGTSALDCTPMGPVPPEGIKSDVSRLIAGVNDLYPDGKVTNDFMIALELIAAQPHFLESKEIEDFNDLYSGSDLDLLPMIDNISSIRESFPESTPVIEIGEEGFLADDLSEHFDYLDDMQEDYEDLVSDEVTAIRGLITGVEGLDPANTYEENYQFAILKYLSLLVGDDLSGGDEDDIVDLAEGCIADDGPGIYVAQIIASSEGLSYTKATSCTPVHSRSSDDKPIENGAYDVSFYPNPASNYLTLPTALDDAFVKIYDIVGHLIFYETNVSGKRIDISKLHTGIYFLQIEGNKDKVRFAKL